MKSFLRLIRWKNILIVALTMCLMRYALMLPVYRYYKINLALSNLAFCLLVVSVLSVFISGNIINAYFDRRTDMINNPNKVLIGFLFNRRKAIFLNAVFSFIGIISGFFVSIIVGKPYLTFFILFSVAILYWYSASLKKKLIIGNLCLAFYVAIVPLLVGFSEYFAYENTLEVWDNKSIHALKFCLQSIIGFSIFGFLYSLIREIIKDCADFYGDVQTGIKSLPIVFGKKNTNYIISSLSLIAVSLILLFWHKYYVNIHFIKFYLFGSFYIYCFIVFPTLIITVASLFGTRKQKYINLISICDFVMLFGVLFSLLFCL